MKQIDPNGGCAFPFNERDQWHGGILRQHQGMYLRDWFAGQALVGLLASHAHPQSQGPSQATPEQYAKASYEIADAMLKAR